MEVARTAGLVVHFILAQPKLISDLQILTNTPTGHRFGFMFQLVPQLRKSVTRDVGMLPESKNNIFLGPLDTTGKVLEGPSAVSRMPGTTLGDGSDHCPN